MTISDRAAHYLSLQLAALRARLDALLRRAVGAPEVPDAAPSLDRELLALGSDDALPARWLRTRLDLSQTEEQVLWLLLGYEVSSEIRGMVMSLAGARDEMTFDLVERIVYGEASAAGWRELGSEGALTRLGLIRADGHSEARHRCRIGLVPRVRGLLHGDAHLTDELRDIARLVDRELPLDELVLSEGVVERVVRELAKPRPFVLATGGTGTGRATLLRAAAISTGASVIDVSCERLAKEPEALNAQLRTIAREARLLRAAVLLRNYDSLASTEAVERRLANDVCGPLMATSTTRSRDGAEVRYATSRPSVESAG